MVRPCWIPNLSLSFKIHPSDKRVKGLRTLDDSIPLFKTIMHVHPSTIYFNYAYDY